MGVIIIKNRFRKRETPVRNYGKEILYAAKENQAMVLLALILLSGMVLGSIYARSAGFNVLERLDFLFAGNFKARETQPFINIFAASFASSFLFVFACFLCGLSMWGAFFIPIILVFRGFGLGLTSGYLYASYGWKGILYNLAVILPGAFVCCLFILLASLEGIRFSRLIASRNSELSYKPNLKSYMLRFGIILSGTCLAALIDLAFSALFGGLFSF